MEAFWGKMKYEQLNDRRFRTREEAKAAVFEYRSLLQSAKNPCELWISDNRRILQPNVNDLPDCL